METQSEVSYDDAMEELQGILEDLSEQKVSMDELPAKVARAKDLVQYCKGRLRQLESGVLELLEDAQNDNA